QYGTQSETLSLRPATVPTDAPARLVKTRARLRSVRQDVWKVADHSRRAANHLQEMLDHHADQARVNRLIAQVQALRDRVEGLQPAFDLVQRLNQTGVLKRARADRQLSIEEANLSPLERQKRQIERDLVNVQWLAEAADVLGGMLDDA